MEIVFSTHLSFIEVITTSSCIFKLTYVKHSSSLIASDDITIKQIMNMNLKKWKFLSEMFLCGLAGSCVTIWNIEFMSFAGSLNWCSFLWNPCGTSASLLLSVHLYESSPLRMQGHIMTNISQLWQKFRVSLMAFFYYSHSKFVHICPFNRCAVVTFLKFWWS